MNQGSFINVAPVYQENSAAGEIRDLVLALFRKIPLIGLTAIATTALAVLYIWTTTPLFSSSVELLIDPRQRRTVENDITPTGLGTSAAGADTWLMESQVEILNSSQVIDELIASENLTSDPEFSGTASDSPVTAIKNLVKLVAYGPQQSHWNEMSPYDRSVLTLRKRMSVERLRNTYVISVLVRSSEPEKAARLANRLAEIYMTRINNAASQTTREAAQSLSSKLEELRNAATAAAELVETYRRDNGLIDTNSTLLIEQRLNELNSELSQARTDTNAALASRNQIRAALQSGTGGANSSQQIAESAVLAGLQTQYAELESQEAELREIYLSSHPRLTRILERKQALDASIQNEYRRILKRLEVSYQTEKQKSEAIEIEVNRLESEMAASNSSTVRLRELELEATASRTIYENFLRRSKEAWEQIDIPRSTAQIISEAKPGSRPSHPRVPLLLAGGAIFGLMLGVCLALMSHLFARRPEPVLAGYAPNIDPQHDPTPDGPYRTPSHVKRLFRTADS